MCQHIMGKVDGPYLVTFFCLLPYTTQSREVAIPVRLQMYLKKPAPIPEKFWSLSQTVINHQRPLHGQP